jgi:LysR family transcriptional activator of nhaA
MFNFNHLYYFYMTAREGGVTKAAGLLKISQPSLSSQLKTLEREMGRTLFIKVGRGLELSSEGQMTYGYCKQIFETAHRLSENLQLKPQSDRSQLHVAVADEIERPFAASYLSRLLKNLDSTLLSARMISDRHATLIESLGKNRFDLLITNYSADEREFETLAQARIPVLAFCSAHSKAFDETELSERRLVALLAQRKPYLSLPTHDQKLRQEIDYFLEQNSLTLPLSFESNVLAAVLRSTVEDLGITFLPVIYLGRELKLKQLKQLSAKPLWHHNLSLVCKLGQKNDSALQQAKKSFEKLIEQY